MREFFKFRENISMAQGVILYKDRVVVLRVLRREILERLHAGHQGVVSMRARVANCVFWPGIDQAIQDVRSRCRTCDYIALSQADEPTITAEPPIYPFQQVATDYCQLDGATYLVVVDRYSGWPSVQHLELIHEIFHVFASGKLSIQQINSVLNLYIKNFKLFPVENLQFNNSTENGAC